MAIRKASAYSKKANRPYTRKSAKKARAYIKTVPFSKIVKFSMGDHEAYKSGKHQYMVRLITEEKVLVRDNALEASRMLLHKLMEEKAPGQYYMMVKVAPHHMIRENKTAAGAGADRMSTGMTQSFGIVIGRAAIAKPGQDIIFVSCTDEKTARIARDSLVTIKPKIPSRTRIIFEKIAAPVVA